MKLNAEERELLLSLIGDHTVCKAQHLPILKKLRQQSDPLEQRMYNLLCAYSLNPLVVPTIDALGQLKGGYALVKAISQQGGLKKFRPAYADFIKKRSGFVSLADLADWQQWDEESLIG